MRWEHLPQSTNIEDRRGEKNPENPDDEIKNLIRTINRSVPNNRVNDAFQQLDNKNNVNRQNKTDREPIDENTKKKKTDNNNDDEDQEKKIPRMITKRRAPQDSYVNNVLFKEGEMKDKVVDTFEPNRPDGDFKGERFELLDHGSWHSIRKTHQGGKSTKNQWGGYSPSHVGSPKYVAKKWKQLKSHYNDSKVNSAGFHFKKKENLQEISKNTSKVPTSINEVTKTKLQSYIGKAVQNYGDQKSGITGLTYASGRNKDSSTLQRKALNRFVGIDRAVAKIANNGVSVPASKKKLDEVSKNTLKDYVKKASSDVGKIGRKIEYGYHGNYTNDNGDDVDRFKTQTNLEKKSKNRITGISKAVDRLSSLKEAMGGYKTKNFKQNLKQKWMSDFENHVVSKEPKHAGKIEWDSAHHFFNQNKSPAEAATRYVEVRNPKKLDEITFRQAGRMVIKKKMHKGELKSLGAHEDRRFARLEKEAEKEKKEEPKKLDEALKLQKTYTEGPHTAKVYRDAEWEEHRVKYFTNGKHLENADSHHSDKEDAHDTAQSELKRMSKINEMSNDKVNMYKLAANHYVDTVKKILPRTAERDELFGSNVAGKLKMKMSNREKTLGKLASVNESVSDDEETLMEQRIKIIKARIRNGKIQRRKKVSNVSGYTLRGGKLKRMSASERRKRKLGARRAKIKRRSKLNRTLVKRKRSLLKRKRLGL